MRILQISSARHFGGGERHLVDLTKGLVSKGHDVFVATTPDSPLVRELQDIPDGNILKLTFRKPFDLSTAWRLRRFARERNVEIIHAHMARDYPLAALAVGNAKYSRLVLTRHVLFPMGGLHRLTRRRVARVIAVSEAVGRSLRQQAIFDEDQIVVVRNGIDVSRFGPPEKRNESSVLRVGILGELSPVKGQQEFVRAAAIVAAKRQDVEFIIAGSDNSNDGKYGRDLKQLIQSNGLSERAQIIEKRIDISEFLAQLDLFVSASHSEAFGLAIVEAMAAGVPVIATNTEGACEILTDGLTGRLVPIGDVAALSDAVIEILSDRGLREDIIDNAWIEALECYSAERMVDETEEVYQSALDG